MSQIFLKLESPRTNPFYWTHFIKQEIISSPTYIRHNWINRNTSSTLGGQIRHQDRTFDRKVIFILVIWQSSKDPSTSLDVLRSWTLTTFANSISVQNVHQTTSTVLSQRRRTQTDTFSPTLHVYTYVCDNVNPPQKIPMKIGRSRKTEPTGETYYITDLQVETPDCQPKTLVYLPVSCPCTGDIVDGSKFCFSGRRAPVFCTTKNIQDHITFRIWFIGDLWTSHTKVSDMKVNPFEILSHFRSWLVWH